MVGWLRGLQLAHRHRGSSRVRHAAWSPDGSRLAVVFQGGEVQLWRPGDTEAVTFSTSRKTKRVIWAPGGGAVSTLDDRGFQTWDAAVGRRLGAVESAGYLESAAWSGDGRIEAAVVTGRDPEERFALLSWDPGAGLWETVHAEPAGLRGNTATSADGRLLALSRQDGSLTVWDLASRRTVASLQGGGRDITALALAPDGSVLAIALGGDVELWDPRTGQGLPALWSGRKVYSLVFSCGGEILAGRSADGRVRLWWSEGWLAAGDFESAAAPGDEVEIAFHPTQPRLATFDEGNTLVRVWDLNFEEIAWRARMSKKKILFLAADPQTAGLPRLQIDHEARGIGEGLDRSRLWDWFQVRIALAVRSTDISRELLDFEPQIVHFSGHGDAGLVIEGRDGDGLHRVTARALRDLLALARNRVECVVLNACSSETEAQEVAEVIDRVVGMAGDIEDRAAIAFSYGFYQALGFGRSYAEAYAHGCAQIEMDMPGGEAGKPVFFRDGERASRELPARSRRSATHV